MPANPYPRPLRPSGSAPLRRPGDPSATFLSARTVQIMALALPLIATGYSAALAMLVARGLPISTGLVILFEIALLGVAIFLCFASGLIPLDVPPILLVFGFFVTALIVTMMIGRPMVETLRSGAIIGLFTMVGYRMTYATLDRLFLWTFAAVLAVLVLEIMFPSAYVTVFQPQAFFSATRGIEASEFNNTGLFNTATSFEGRFNFGLFTVPRTSSIFLEQVSNGNFAAIGALYLSVRGRAIDKRALLLGVATVFLILVTTNARFASLLVALTCVGYFVFPLLPRATLPLASIAIFLGVLLISMHDIEAATDDFQGRISFVARKFRAYDIPFYLGFEAGTAVRERDSGYSFFIGTTSIFGMIGLWCYINLWPRMNDAPSRRLAWGTVAYFLGQLIVSSTSLLSIKTAALLWVLIGCVRADRSDPVEQAT